MELNTPKTSAKIRYGYAAIERTIQINSPTTQAMFATNSNKTEADTIIITTHSTILPDSLSLSAHLVSLPSLILAPRAAPRNCLQKGHLILPGPQTARPPGCYNASPAVIVNASSLSGSAMSFPGWARRSSGSKICVSSSAMNDSCRKSRPRNSCKRISSRRNNIFKAGNTNHFRLF